MQSPQTIVNLYGIRVSKQLQKLSGSHFIHLNKTFTHIQHFTWSTPTQRNGHIIIINITQPKEGAHLRSRFILLQPIAYGSHAIWFATYFPEWFEFPMGSTGTISEVFGVFAAAVSPEWLRGGALWFDSNCRKTYGKEEVQRRKSQIEVTACERWLMETCEIIQPALRCTVSFRSFFWT